MCIRIWVYNLIDLAHVQYTQLHQNQNSFQLRVVRDDLSRDI